MEIKKINENNEEIVIRVEGKVKLEGYTTYYKIGSNSDWKKVEGDIIINNLELTEEILEQSGSIRVEAKIENEKNRNMILNAKNIEIATSINFEYTGLEETVELYPGKYKLEVWGAQGGNAETKIGGYGGYSVGTIEVSNKTTLFVNVGGQGSTIYGGTIEGGYNGGGSAHSWGNHYTEGSGGGATHMALSTGLLKEFSDKRDDVLIVAGGGGGANYDDGTSQWCTSGGSGGGINGDDTISERKAIGGTQIAAGYNGGFGYGGNAVTLQGGRWRWLVWWRCC